MDESGATIINFPGRRFRTGGGPTFRDLVHDTEVHPSHVWVAERIALCMAQLGTELVFSEAHLYRFAGTHWRALTDAEKRLLVHPFDGATTTDGKPLRLTRGFVSGTLSELAAILAKDDFFEGAPVGINCATGFIQFADDGSPTLLRHAREHRQRWVLPGRWTPGYRPTDELLRTLVEGCFREGPDGARKAIVLAEVAGAIALGIGTKLTHPKAIVLVGEKGANGKSQVLDALRHLVPEDAVTSIAMTDLRWGKYRVRLAGKLLNICAELGTSTSVAADKFKAAITGDPLSAYETGQPLQVFRPMATHVFATNELPPFQGGMSPAVSRRLLVLRFDRVIPPEERIANIGDKIGERELDALLFWAVRGARRLVRRNRYSEPPSSTEALREWHREADPVLAFLDDDAAVRVVDGGGAEVPTKVAYQVFRAWAREVGIGQPPNLMHFARRVLASGRGITGRRTSKCRYLVGLELVER